MSCKVVCYNSNSADVSHAGPRLCQLMQIADPEAASAPYKVEIVTGQAGVSKVAFNIGPGLISASFTQGKIDFMKAQEADGTSYNVSRPAEGVSGRKLQTTMHGAAIPKVFSI